MKSRSRIRGVIRAGSVCVVAMLASSSCSMPEPAESADRGEGEDRRVIAVIGNIEITEEEVSGLMAAQLLKVDRERQQILEQGLERLAAQKLIELEADQRGISADELLASEVEGRLVAPSEEEIDSFYEERKDRIRQPKDEVAGQIGDYLVQQQRVEAHGSLVSALKEKHGFRSLLEPLRVAVDADGFPSKGPVDAPVTIVEFSDFECPYCARVTPTLDRVMENYGDRVRLVFRQFPLLNLHSNAQKAAEASLCAHEQAKFWEMHDTMFKEQQSLGLEQLKEKAARLGLDTEAFNDCLDSGRQADAVTADLEAGSQVGVTGTPAMFINGRFLSGAQPYEDLADIIDDELGSPKAGS